MLFIALAFCIAACVFFLLWFLGEERVSAAFVVSAVVCVGLLLHCALACLVALTAMEFYWFTFPHLVLLALAVAAVVTHARSRGIRAFGASLICVTCLLPTWYFAMSLSPGGWDGLVWFVYIGLMSLLSVIIGLPLIYVAHRLYQGNAGQTP